MNLRIVALTNLVSHCHGLSCSEVFRKHVRDADDHVFIIVLERTTICGLLLPSSLGANDSLAAARHYGMQVGRRRRRRQKSAIFTTSSSRPPALSFQSNSSGVVVHLPVRPSVRPPSLRPSSVHSVPSSSTLCLSLSHTHGARQQAELAGRH